MKRSFLFIAAIFLTQILHAAKPIHDYPLRLKIDSLQEDPGSRLSPSMHGTGDDDIPTGKFLALAYDIHGPLRWLSFTYINDSCFTNPHARYHLHGYFPARWESPNKIAIVNDTSTDGTKIHECHFKLPPHSTSTDFAKEPPDSDVTAKIFAKTDPTTPWNRNATTNLAHVPLRDRNNNVH